jgi:hypothetical protein
MVGKRRNPKSLFGGINTPAESIGSTVGTTEGSEKMRQ